MGVTVDLPVCPDRFRDGFIRGLGSVPGEHLGTGSHDSRPLDAIIDSGRTGLGDRLVEQCDGFVDASERGQCDRAHLVRGRKPARILVLRITVDLAGLACEVSRFPAASISSAVTKPPLPPIPTSLAA